MTARLAQTPANARGQPWLCLRHTSARRRQAERGKDGENRRRGESEEEALSLSEESSLDGAWGPMSRWMGTGTGNV
ncbi:hypothetical protein EYF80_064365 [Liparis tanakae]|uniref:Uncharacterized protein n=1 Tax=Liparis tanakae TaxID=230148 RepID=A0A4Z2E9R6_9TELE|nr:hypothetical protein EYF80_064365 [Liparis tanakae]